MKLGFGDHWAKSKQLFADQFELSGSGYIYRKWQKGPAIQVAPDERDRFIRDYGRRLRNATWIIFAGMLIGLAIFVWWSVARDSDPSDFWLYFITGALVGIVVVYTLWAGGAPARELSRRTPVADERSKAEFRKLMLRKMKYGEIVGLAIAGALMPFALRGNHDIYSGWGRLWLVFGAAIVGMAAFAAVRKWRFDRSDKP